MTPTSILAGFRSAKRAYRNRPKFAIASSLPSKFDAA